MYFRLFNFPMRFRHPDSYRERPSVRGGQVSSGAWTREVPQPQSLFDEWSCGSAGGTPFDSGIFAYSTGNSQSEDVQDTEVSGGTTWLSTLPMDLTQAIYPKISFDYWLCEFPPNQYEGLYMWVSNGVDTFLLDILRNDTIVGSWQSKLYDNLAIPDPLDQVRFMVSARDTTTGSNFYVLKAHIDNFELIDGSLGTDNASNSLVSFDVYPNPLTGERIYFTSLPTDKTKPLSITITDLHGRVFAVDSKPVLELFQGLEVNLSEDLYFVQWSAQSSRNGIAKLVVLKE